ncbi:sensor domain-containing diguanylate cyclase [Aureimonas pseudogalii]|uniref:Diguanylate cyclase (GGDEF)-like protein n=1 Tax=Aureimonas pseudogalii TaxID=1744844 RepID=A0A7W6E9B6_9HYPH|nr:sensor domain-containing diguanylate cyclase [Aureimonas pseudogalii]MBB3997135.1 diguanylate cyclase (GGDEF)-like protein [Aureimonas pseudogalii]
MLSIDISVLAVPSFVIDVGPGGSLTIAAMNRPSEVATGLSATTTVGRSPAQCLPAPIAASLEARYRRCIEAKTLQEYDETFDQSAPQRWWRTTLTPVLDPRTGAVAHIVGVSVEITERKCDEDRLRILALTDGLTALANRRGFERAFADATSRPHDPRKGVGLVLIDLDGFKAINDTFGHRRGDDVLRLVGLLLARSAGRPQSVARIGGDEFALLTSSSSEAELARSVAALRRFLDRHLADLHVSTGFGASVGAALWSRGQAFEDLLASADAAMYRQKASRKAVAA